MTNDFSIQPNQPLLVGFNVTRRDGLNFDKEQVPRACSLGDLKDWLNEEKEKRKVLVGTVAIILLSIGCSILRWKLSK
jgi:hypothetical protein